MPTYLVQTSFAHCFRRAVPVDLRPVIGLRELRYSLGTLRKREAQRTAKKLAAATSLLFDKIRTTEMSKLAPEQLTDIVHNYIKNWLKADAEEAPKNSIDDVCEYHYDMGSAYTEQMEECYLERHRGKYNRIAHLVDMTLEAQGLTLEDVGSSHDELCHEIATATLSLLQSRLALASSKVIKAEEITNDLLKQYPATPTAQPVIPAIEEDDDGNELLRNVVERYCAENERENWKPKTAKENRAALQLFLDFVGHDIKCNQLSYKLIRNYKDALSKLPPNRNKDSRYKGKSIQELLAMDCEPMKTNTANKMLNRLSGFLETARKEGFVKENYAADMTFKKRRSAKDKRSPYTHEDLIALFHSEQYTNDTHEKPFQFWAPIIALFTGMRVNEIAQLHLDDIHNQDGVWVFDINNNTDDKKVKNQNAKRKIPLAPFLVKTLRLPDYVAKLRADGEQRLFPEITRHRDGYGQRISRWFNGDGGKSKFIGYRRQCGIESTKDVRKDFHSFRHTAIDHLKQKLHEGVNVDCMLYVNGHGVRDSETFKRYGTDFKPTMLFETVTKYITHDVDLDLAHLAKSKWVVITDE